MDKLQNESDFQYKVRLCVAKLNKEIDLDWIEIIEQLGLDVSSSHLRKLAYGYKEIIDSGGYVPSENIDVDNVKYKEVTEIMENGTQKSDKLVKMSVDQSKDVNYLLAAHGFDKDSWQLMSAKNNIWNVSSKKQGVQTLYSSKISVKPKIDGLDMDKLVELMSSAVKPVSVTQNKKTSTDKLLEIPLFDMHFGIADFEHYNETLNAIAEKITSKKWNTILFVIGQDLLHNDGFEGTTTSGTMIDKVNMEQAWSDADKFYTTLLTLALENSNTVDGIYSNGNHDKGISYGFVKMLEAKFPQVNFESSMKTRKAYVYNDVFIGISHGDKGKARLEKNFYSEFGKEIANANVLEIHTGHIHHEIAKDNLGFLVRSLATKAKTDGYHYDNGFIGAAKRFQLFEFSKDTLDTIYYV